MNRCIINYLILILISVNAFGNNKTSLQQDTAKVNRLIDLSYRQFINNKLDDALISAETALKLSRKHHYTKGEIDAINQKGLVRFYQSSFTEAEKLFETGLKLAKDNDYTLGKANAYYGLSYILSVKGQYSKSEEYMNTALAIFKQYKLKPKIGECYQGLGYLYDRLNKSDKSLKAYKEALKIYKELNDSSNIADGHNSLGHWYFNYGDYKRALEHYFEAMSIWSVKNDSVRMSIVYGNLANVYKTQKEYDKALELYSKQINLLKNTQNYQLALAYQNVGVLYINMKDYKNAKISSYKAEKIFKRTGFKLGLIYAYNNLSHAYLIEGTMDSAMVYANKSIRLSAELNEKRNYGYASLLLGRIYLKKGETAFAGYHLKKAIKYSQECQDMETEKIATRKLGDIYKDKGNYKEALNLIERHYKLADSLQSQENIRKLTQLELGYEFDREKQHIELENAREKAMLTVELKNQRLIRNFLITSSILLLCIIGIIFYAFLQNRKTNKLLNQQKNEIELKNNQLSVALKEKEALIKEIHHRVKNNLQIVSSLLNIQTEYSNDEQIIGAVHESQCRVKAMALIHQLLYQEENFTNIDFKNYLQQLAKTLEGIYKTSQNKVKTEILADKIAMDIDTSIPLGLIVTELVSNAYKYAFSDSKQGHIKIELTGINDHYELSISDNGKGLPDSIDIHNANSMGLKLVKLLSEQIDGDLSVNRIHGTTFKLVFNTN